MQSGVLSGGEKEEAFFLQTRAFGTMPKAPLKMPALVAQAPRVMPAAASVAAMPPLKAMKLKPAAAAAPTTCAAM
jgi:hypothetical protein